ncbi:hypothetical protein D3C86_2183090 [compost metagenome]
MGIVGLIKRLLDSQHMIVNHGLGKEWPRQLGSHTDRQGDEGYNECIFSRQGVLE